MMEEHAVFVDLETTGATATADRITEIGIVEMRDGRQVGEWSMLVNPGMSIPPMIQALTGITNDMVALAPSFAEIHQDVLRRLDGKLFIAHNARFDYAFLKNEFRRCGVTFNARVLCTVKLSRRLYPMHARHNLDTLMERHSIACDARHRALGDAKVLWQLMQQWSRERSPALLQATIDLLVKTPTVPAGLPDFAFDDIPETPGVYLFYGDNEVLLYVGKSINIRARVMSHFSGDHRVSKDLHIGREIRRIDWRQTAGELGALLLESRLIKELAPVHNRMLRRNNQCCAWQWETDGSQDAPRLVTAQDIDPARFDSIHGLFRSRAAALEALREVAAAHGLCNIVLGLERRTGNGPCFAHQIKRCKGVCVGLESPQQHALRVSAALASMRSVPWPYAGRIAVREQEGEKAELHVIDRWCHIGTARDEAELAELAPSVASSGAPVFDVDTYKILRRFLAKLPKGARIIRLAA